MHATSAADAPGDMGSYRRRKRDRKCSQSGGKERMSIEGTSLYAAATVYDALQCAVKDSDAAIMEPILCSSIAYVNVLAWKRKISRSFT